MISWIVTRKENLNCFVSPILAIFNLHSRSSELIKVAHTCIWEFLRIEIFWVCFELFDVSRCAFQVTHHLDSLNDLKLNLVYNISISISHDSDRHIDRWRRDMCRVSRLRGPSCPTYLSWPRNRTRDPPRLAHRFQFAWSFVPHMLILNRVVSRGPISASAANFRGREVQKSRSLTVNG